MEEPRIRDIRSISDVVKLARDFVVFKWAFPLVKPFLRLLGADISSVTAALASADDLRVRAEEIARIPDRFNALFSSRGWIVHADMSLNVAKEAIALAEEGDMESSERRLVEYYSPENAKSMLRRMTAVLAFRPRMRLAQLALSDYEQGRLHACVPVVLALLDGLVSELHEQQRGFFAEDVELSAWDSIAAHESGLTAVAKIFQKGRRKINEQPLTLPYRHGILHGTDVAYDNPLVAAKTWAALFSVREWALKVEQGAAKPPPPKRETTLKELISDWRTVEDTKRRISEWEPRVLTVRENVPASGSIDDYAEGSPERSLVEYLELWKLGNYGFMSRSLELPFTTVEYTAPHRVREVYQTKQLRAYQIHSIEDKAPSATEIEVLLEFEEDGEQVEHSHSFRLVYWDPGGNTAIRGDAGGKWGIVNWHV